MLMSCSFVNWSLRPPTIFLLWNHVHCILTVPPSGFDGFIFLLERERIFAICNVFYELIHITQRYSICCCSHSFVRHWKVCWKILSMRICVVLCMWNCEKYRSIFCEFRNCEISNLCDHNRKIMVRCIHEKQTETTAEMMMMTTIRWVVKVIIMKIMTVFICSLLSSEKSYPSPCLFPCCL